jgi:hypothetical protein
MTQALYAHMNNKRKIKETAHRKKKKRSVPAMGDSTHLTSDIGQQGKTHTLLACYPAVVLSLK